MYIHISQINLGNPLGNQQVPLYNVFSNPELTTSPYTNLGDPGLGLRSHQSPHSPGLEGLLPASQPTLLPSYDTTSMHKVTPLS